MALQWVDLDGLDSVMTYIWERLALKADKADLTTAVRFMGSVATYAELPTSGNRTGDMWNVAEDGSNYCWTAEGKWDDLSGIIDLSNYYTIKEAEAAFVMLNGEQTVNGIKTFNSRMLKLHGTYTPEFLTSSDSSSTTTASYTAFLRMRAKGDGNLNNDAEGTVGLWEISRNAEGTYCNVTVYNASGESATFQIRSNDDGNKYASAPTPSSSSDNSNRIATTAWVNSTSTVVHTTGAEEIDGIKTFNNQLVINGTSNKGVLLRCLGINIAEIPSSLKSYNYAINDVNDALLGSLNVTRELDGDTVIQIISKNLDSNGGDVDGRIKIYTRMNGEAYVTAPATRNTGYGSTDIATAGWVDSKLAAVTATAVTQEQIDAIVARLDALEAAS